MVSDSIPEYMEESPVEKPNRNGIPVHFKINKKKSLNVGLYGVCITIWNSEYDLLYSDFSNELEKK